MTFSIELVKYEAPSVNETKAAINKQFAGHSLKIAQDILANGSWLAPTPWYVAKVTNHLDAMESHVNGHVNALQYKSAISQYKSDQASVIVDVDNTQEDILAEWTVDLHEKVDTALKIDLLFKTVVAVSAFVFVVTLLPINAIPLSASMIAGKAFGVTAVAYAARSAWNMAYPPGKEVAEKIRNLLTTDSYWKKVLA